MSESLEVALDAHALLGECPVWDDRTETLLWVDIHRNEVHRFSPSTGSDQRVLLEATPGAVALRAGGGLVAAVGMGFGELDQDSMVYTEWQRVARGDRMNDGACDPAGRFLAGTLTEAQIPGAASLFALDPVSRQVREILPGVTLSNGLAWNRDGTTLYFVDTVLERIDAFDYDVGTARLSARRTVVNLQDAAGRPDGLCIDSEGNLWVAMAQGRMIRCYGTNGRLLHLVRVPSPIVTSCTFGGPGLADLYITTGEWPASTDQLRRYPHAGAVFRLAGTGSHGLPAHRFAG
ncbi:SMP-30/gluconolactonase/LRE family protein (plasmid) [Arthrobacter sp. YA7-1]|uniref:SMP-30/gluconolactonase/LRE family protein n=1 Tax=Arthrobacter sp. YA7-1 TaxID=2987701 RepID=UPI002226A15A|nr:SMP-30/gluconolactonase/LRE family protein [Arthrobacter sp. YA7-1]UYY83580.1 SMP-30/gluconolactonase/LRE family protein [Arthrobacter sp. YA7-1]